jgi:hypothetical protein
LFSIETAVKPTDKVPFCEVAVCGQQFTGTISPYRFQQTSYNMMPLQQTINRTPTTSSTKNNTQNESETTTNYTWQQVKERKISHQTPEIKMVGNPILFNTKQIRRALKALR